MEPTPKQLMLHVRYKKIKDGLVISAKCESDIIPIATIRWSTRSNDCFIKTIGDRFQTYIVTYEDYLNFIRLTDEAFDMLRREHHKQIEQ